MTQTELPQSVLATWKAEDWDDDKMTSSFYTYFVFDEDGYRGDEIYLSEEQAALYYWGQCDDNLTGGTQLGTLK